LKTNRSGYEKLLYIWKGDKTVEIGMPKKEIIVEPINLPEPLRQPEREPVHEPVREPVHHESD
jgi:hypothetical protein